VTDGHWRGLGIDTSVPNVARIYDYWLGGKDNFAADREAAEVRRLIDFSQPVAVLLLAILHVIPDEADPFGAVARIRAALSPGSYLVISHADVSTAHAVGTRRLSETARELEEADKARAGVPSRSRDEIAGFFGDLTLVEPGLTDVWAWRPEGDQVTMTSDYLRIIGGVARKG
jgi:hypothetical protein